MLRAACSNPTWRRTVHEPYVFLHFISWQVNLSCITNAEHRLTWCTFTGDAGLGQAKLQHWVVDHERFPDDLDPLVPQQILTQIQDLQDLQHWLQHRVQDDLLNPPVNHCVFLCASECEKF